MRKSASKINMISMNPIKPAPEKQGTFRIDARTVIDIPAHIKDVEKWKADMITKYEDYHRRNEIGRLTGAAKNKLSVSSKLLRATNEL